MQVNAQSTKHVDNVFDEQIKQTLKKNAETLRFIENKGQIADKKILYYFEGTNGSAFIEATNIRFIANNNTFSKAILPNKTIQSKRSIKATHTFSISFSGAISQPQFILGNTFKTKYNFFLGNNIVQGARAAKDLLIKNVYEGINLRLYSSEEGTLEFDWILAPGADLKKIKLNFKGQDKLSIDKNGQLEVGLRFTKVKFRIPESYQVNGQNKCQVKISFQKEGFNTISFSSGSVINPNESLVIDPVLNWGTLMDANNSAFDEYLFAIQVDSTDGMVYCAGTTNRTISTSSAPYDADGYSNSISGLSGGTGVSSLPNVALIYRINSSGNDLVDMTLFGPGTVSGSNLISAYALSLSPNNVFIGGSTNVNLPMAGTPFDNSRSSTDGYVAVFSRDLGTLSYSTYLGGTGSETRGVTSIRAIDDNSFVVGMTAAASLPTSGPNYISAGAAQSGFGGGTDFYLAKFSSLNSLDWGTYVGGAGNETFNDLEILQDGRVAFCGYTTGTFTLTNSTGNSGSGEDGVIGVLKSTCSSYDYLDRIGGSGNDRFYDVEIVGENLYFSGSGASGFPTSAGAYDETFNGGSSDAVIGTVSTSGGSASYKATYYGSSGKDFGDGIRLVTKTGCPTSETLILAFGTVGASGMPTMNVKDESFFNSDFTPGGNSGLDMFFSGFTEDLSTLKYGTYMGGSQDDYLGATGDPRGANQLWVNGTNAYVGTTTHSSSHTPTILSGGFDVSKSNGNNDAQIIFSIEFGGIFDTVSLAPLSAVSNKAFVCPGEPATLTVNGGYLGTNAHWDWYTTSCGATYLDSGQSITVYPLVTTTYYVRAEGSCNTTSCAEVTVPLLCILADNDIFLTGTIQQQFARLSYNIPQNEKINYVEIQRSFNAIDYIRVKDFTLNDYANKNGYTFSENVNDINEAAIYYRIKVTDINGNITYSDVLKLNLHEDLFKATISPNPSNGFTNIGFNAKSTGMFRIELYNTAGKLLRTINHHADAGYNTFRLDKLDRFAPGMYFIRISNNMHTSYLKLAIK